MSPPAARPPRARAEPPRPRIAADQERAAQLADVLKAVAHPLRLRIVAILVEGEQNVTALAEKLGASQAIVSQQLRILRSTGLVAVDRQGGFATYRLVERNLETLVHCMENCSR
ncbi:MAG TPA: metalloregulator ArsR/SmtB family transcription factor [Anaeromyxobacteraceae bacterium]|nr:metalloregulator ArsR/SmtB family transcription factor [Anaeromyxobacteraceae bacterium]